MTLGTLKLSPPLTLGHTKGVISECRSIGGKATVDLRHKSYTITSKGDRNIVSRKMLLLKILPGNFFRGKLSLGKSPPPPEISHQAKMLSLGKFSTY